MTILLILVTTWFLIGAGYAIAIIRHLDEYSAEWFVKYLRIDDQEHEFKDERQKKAVNNMTAKECLFYMRIVGFFGLLVAGPIGSTIAPYKETVADIKLWRNAGVLHKARKTNIT